MTDMNQALQELLAHRQAEQRERLNEVFGKAPPEPPEELDVDALRREVADARAAAERAHREAGTPRGEPEADAESFAREAAEARDAPPTPSFDGGARETPPGPAPGMDSLIRAGREQRARELFDRADQLDRDASPFR